MSRKTKPPSPVDLSRVHLKRVGDRPAKVSGKMLAGVPEPGASVAALLESLPKVLAANDLRAVIAAVAQAYRRRKPVIVGLGGHVIKCGCTPIVVDLLQRGVITGVVFHGATAIHDYELAALGRTSEDVTAHLADGSFGMVQETGDFFARALSYHQAEQCGLGRSAGLVLAKEHAKTVGRSILASAALLDVPATVHVALGTDTIHMHPAVDMAALGAASGYDFRLLCDLVTRLQGGVYLNLGSAVILPEVFLKALTVARNLGNRVDKFVTANFDMQRHYRPSVNVVQRPTQTGYHITGHHEIMLPLLRLGILEAIEHDR